MSKSPKTKEYLKLERQRQVSNMYLAGKTQWEIARIVGVSQGTITNDLKQIRQLWQSQSLTDYDAKVAEEIAKIDRLEEVAMEAWHRSCQDAEIHHKKTESIQVKEDRRRKKPKRRAPGESPTVMVPIKVVEDHKRIGQAGDEKFLGRVAWCVEMRLRLIGALKEQTNVNVGNLNINWDDLAGRPDRTPGDALEDRISSIVALPAPEANGTVYGEANGTQPINGEPE